LLKAQFDLIMKSTQRFLSEVIDITTLSSAASASPYCANLSDFKCSLGIDFGLLPRSLRRKMLSVCARGEVISQPHRDRASSNLRETGRAAGAVR